MKSANAKTLAAAESRPRRRLTGRRAYQKIYSPCQKAGLIVAIVGLCTVDRRPNLGSAQQKNLWHHLCYTGQSTILVSSSARPHGINPPPCGLFLRPRGRTKFSLQCPPCHAKPPTVVGSLLFCWPSRRSLASGPACIEIAIPALQPNRISPAVSDSDEDEASMQAGWPKLTPIWAAPRAGHRPATTRHRCISTIGRSDCDPPIAAADDRAGHCRNIAASRIAAAKPESPRM